MHTTRRGLAMALASFLIAGASSFVGASPASADQRGRLNNRIGLCLENHYSAGVVANQCNGRLEQTWTLKIVAWVGEDPRYQVISSRGGDCLVAFASSGRVGTHDCNSNWADQVWAFQYVKYENGSSFFWLRNKHSGRCLALNRDYNPDAFMTSCAQYGDQLWRAPAT
jgi:hypothetical protein